MRDRLSGSLTLIVVLGHSWWGALTAAVDVFLNPTDYVPFVAARINPMACCPKSQSTRSINLRVAAVSSLRVGSFVAKIRPLRHVGLAPDNGRTQTRRRGQVGFGAKWGHFGLIVTARDDLLSVKFVSRRID